MSKQVAAIILNYKHEEDTMNCVRSILASDFGKIDTVYIVDNSPTKANRTLFKSHFPKVNYIASPSNLGFAGGNNQGIRDALAKGADYVLIANPDVELPKTFFAPLLKHFNDKQVGIVGPAISHRQKDGLYFGLDGKVDWSLAKPEHTNLKKLVSKKPIDAQFVTFACVLISKENFAKVGLLDSNYFMYFEDVDYCLTTGKHGQKIILDPQVVVTHETSSSFAKPTGKLMISFKSQIRFINKWLPVSQRIKPLIHACLLYPYLYVLWTYHYYKYSNKR